MRMWKIQDGRAMTRQQLLQAVALDRLVYPAEYWLEEETVLGYYSRHPEIYVFAHDEGKLIGYVNCSCIGAHVFELLSSGIQHDVCITPNDLRTPSPNECNHLYLSSVVVHPAWRGKGIARAMFARYARYLDELLDRDILFTDVIADAISPHGERLCNSLGMERALTTHAGTSLYHLKLGCKESTNHLIKRMKGE